MCGKTGLSTVEGDGGTECQLSDKRWTCSEDCYDRATETPMDQSLWRFWNEKARQQATEIAALRAENERLRLIEDSIISAEHGYTAEYVLINYRAIRREIQDRRAALRTTEELEGRNDG
jgi:hypothetical protein